MKRMTIGADTEYFLPSEREPRNFLELPDTLLDLIESACRQVAETNDLGTKQEIARSLNDIFIQDDLLGRTARVRSDLSVIVSRKLDDQGSGLTPAYNPEVTSGEQYEGVFLGCAISSVSDGTPELVYLLELPLVTEDLVFRTVITPVHQATLSVEVNLPAPQKAGGELWQSLELLHTIDDEVVQKNLYLMTDLMEATNETDADFLKEMGLLATEILARPLIMDNLKARDAISKIFASCVDEGAWYLFEGLRFGVVLEEKERFISVDEMEAVGQIHSATITEDFDYTYAQKDKPAHITLKKTLQPAYVFLDTHNVEYVVPVRYFTLFTMDRYSPDEATCGAAREHFLEAYPNLFKKKQREGV
ncbi:MAG TPA: hypothetical protein VN081_01545 [Dongiaceae bacterium]|nr:hypothetical protein [Dongiaceae bacterium]